MAFPSPRASCRWPRSGLPAHAGSPSAHGPRPALCRPGSSARHGRVTEPPHDATCSQGRAAGRASELRPRVPAGGAVLYAGSAPSRLVSILNGAMALTHTHAHTHMRTRTHHVHTRAHAYTHTRMCARMHTPCTCMRTHAHTHTPCTHMHARTLTHAHTCAHTMYMHAHTTCTHVHVIYMFIDIHGYARAHTCNACHKHIIHVHTLAPLLKRGN